MDFNHKRNCSGCIIAGRFRPSWNAKRLWHNSLSKKTELKWNDNGLFERNYFICDRISWSIWNITSKTRTLTKESNMNTAQILMMKYPNADFGKDILFLKQKVGVK